jgi:uncharacterized protein
MSRVKKGILTTIIVYLSIYIATVILFIFTQDKFFFHPEKLQKDYKYNFPGKYEELNIIAADDSVLNGIIFKADTAKGLIFFLHGNSRSLREFIEISKYYTDLKYDLFVLDYRGFGKSEGTIVNEAQLSGDIQIAYDRLKSRYAEKNIVIYGYSLGSGLAVKLASVNNPGLLILQAPYYSWTDLFKHDCPVIPTFLVKYKIETYKYIRDCKMPIVIFHGDNDKTVYYGSSVKLMKLAKPADKLITISGWGHTSITRNQQYIKELGRVLE